MQSRIVAAGLVIGLCVVSGCSRGPKAPRNVDYAAAANKTVSDAAPQGDDAWGELQSIARDATLLARTTGGFPVDDAAYFKLKSKTEGDTPFPEYGLRRTKAVGDKPTEHDQLRFEVGDRVRVAFEASDLSARLATLASRNRFVRPVLAGSLGTTNLPDTGAVRTLAGINNERFYEAMERGDDAALPALLDQNLTLARAYFMQGSHYERLLGRLIEAYSFTAVKLRLTKPAGDALLQGFDKALARHAESTWNQEAMIEWQRCELLHDAQAGEDSGRDVKDGLDKAHAALARWSETEIAAARKPLPARWAEEKTVTAVFEEVSKDSEYVKSKLVPLQGFHEAAVAAAERPGLVVMVALERFRLAKGKYPENLAELSPTYLKVVPADPGSGQPLVYRQINPPDAQGRGYLLYSVGADGKDDGGVLNKMTRSYSMRVHPNATGTDFIINQLGD